MKFSKRLNYALIGFIAMLNIAFRYPTTPHQIGADSFHLHMVANSVSHYGYATWIVHPFSFFGLTPETVPTAYPYILSALSQLSGLDMEATILLFSILVGLIGTFNAFLMAKEIKNDDLFIYIVVFAFSLSPVFLSYTIWTVTGRNLFLALFPLFIWSVFRNLNRAKLDYKYIGMSVILFIILLSIHRMAMLIPIFIFAFIVTVFLYKKLTKLSMPSKTSIVAPFIWIGIFIFFLFAQLLSWGFYSDLGLDWVYQEGYLFKGGGITDKILNMGVDYGGKYGPLFIFGIFAMIIMLFFTKRYFKGEVSKIKVNRNFFSLLFPLIILFYTPLLLLGVYTSLVLLPFICLIIGFGVIYLFERLKNARNLKFRKIFKKLAVVIIISSLIIASVFALFMINLWRRPIAPADDTVWMSEETYDTALYLTEFGNKSNFIMNDWIVQSRITSIYNEDLYMRLNLSQVTIERGNFLDLYYSDTLYIITSREFSGIENIHSLSFDKGPQKLTIFMSQNNIKFAIEKNNIPEGQYMGSGGVLRNSNLYKSIFQERYKTYDNGDISVWNVD